MLFCCAVSDDDGNAADVAADAVEVAAVNVLWFVGDIFAIFVPCAPVAFTNAT